MALNIVDLDETVPLGFGLEYRLNKQEVTKAAAIQIYCKKSNINSSSEISISDEMDSQYKFNTAAETMQISSTDANDDQIVTIYYYADNTEEAPSTQTVILNGQTAVTLSSDIFRIHRMVITSTSGMNQGSVYLSPDTQSLTAGKPDDNIRCSMPANRGFSMQSYLYIPASWKGYMIQQHINSNSSSSLNFELKAYRQPSAVVPNLIYNNQSTPIVHPSIVIEVNTAQAMNAGTLLYYTIKRTNGSTDGDIEFYADVVLIK